MKKLIHTAVLASVAAFGVASVPASAQGYYERGDTYYGREYDRRDDRRYARESNAQYYDQRGYADGYRGDDRQYSQNCRRSSGTTGTILGAIAGGLLGREIGRGGYANRPSTTGLLLGAGAGALAGRAVDKSASCDRRR